MSQLARRTRPYLPLCTTVTFRCCAPVLIVIDVDRVLLVLLVTAVVTLMVFFPLLPFLGEKLTQSARQVAVHSPDDSKTRSWLWLATGYNSTTLPDVSVMELLLLSSSHPVASKTTAKKRIFRKSLKTFKLGFLRYFTNTTRYLLVDQNSCGSVMRSTYCLLASRCSV